MRLLFVSVYVEVAFNVLIIFNLFARIAIYTNNIAGFITFEVEVESVKQIKNIQ